MRNDSFVPPADGDRGHGKRTPNADLCGNTAIGLNARHIELYYNILVRTPMGKPRSAYAFGKRLTLK